MIIKKNELVIQYLNYPDKVEWNVILCKEVCDTHKHDSVLATVLATSFESKEGWQGRTMDMTVRLSDNPEFVTMEKVDE